MEKGNSFISKLVTLAGLGLLLVSCQSPKPVAPIDVEAPSLADNSPVSFALVALAGTDEASTRDGVNQETVIGCGDTVVAVTHEIPADPSNLERQRITLALEALFAVENQYYGESGLYNALYQSNLEVDGVSYVKTNNNPQELTITLSGEIASGGVCDDPRIVAQILETVKANAPENAIVHVTINGKDLATYFDMSGE